MEDMHIHLKDGIKDQTICNQYVDKCIKMNLKKVVFLDHGNRISPKHNAVLYSKETIDLFNKTINILNESTISEKIKVLRGIEIDYSNDIAFRKETQKILDYGNFEWIIGAVHSMKFETLQGYLEAVIDLINNYNINAIAHLKLDNTYKKYEYLLIKILKLCSNKNIFIEINTSDRARWTNGQLYYMLNLMDKYKVDYVLASDAHKVDEVGYMIEETIKKVKKWKQNI